MHTKSLIRCTCSLLFPDINSVVTDNSVGEPNANCEAMIVNEETGNEITSRGPDARGELWCRGENVMKGCVRGSLIPFIDLSLARFLVLTGIKFPDIGATLKPQPKRSRMTAGLKLGTLRMSLRLGNLSLSTASRSSSKSKGIKSPPPSLRLYCSGIQLSLMPQ